MKCIIDSGLQKTGSKARQLFFTAHLYRVNSTTVIYLYVGRDNIWHRPLFESFHFGDKSVLNSLASEIKQLSDETSVIILSYEEMYKLEKEQIQWIQQIFPDLTVSIFLRRQDQISNSLHNQLHKAHRVNLQSIQKFEKNLLEYNPDYDYQLILRR